MKKKKQAKKSRFVTKEYLLEIVQYLSNEIRKMLHEFADEHFRGTKEKLDELHVSMNTNFKEIKWATKFLEKEIVANRLKIKELEKRLNTFTSPGTRLKN